MDPSTNKRMIIEGQFLLSFLLQAKKMGHKYYAIVRQSERMYIQYYVFCLFLKRYSLSVQNITIKNMICFRIHNIKNQVYVIDNNYEKYKSKVVELTHNHDSGALMKQLFWRPHVILSIVLVDKFYPLFSEISEQFGVINGKFVIFFLNCLFFHSFVMLKEPDDVDNNFLKKYFVWGNSPYTFSGWTNNHFYRIPISSIVPSSSQSTIANLILTKKYWKVFRFNGAGYVCNGIFFCVK